jgi:Domain of unknown function (DUF4332)
MSLVLIEQIWVCLLAAFGLGLFVGWLCKQLSVSQKRSASPRQDEILVQSRESLAKEREVITMQINALRTQVEIATTALQSREASLAKLETDLIEQFATLSAANAQTEKLQTRLIATELALQQNTQSAITLETEVRTLHNELGNKDQELRQMLLHLEEHSTPYENLKEQENHIAELTAHFHSLLNEKETTISHLQAQVATLEPLSVQLSECTSTLQEAEAYYQTAVRDKDAEIIRLQAHINTLKFPDEDSTTKEARISELKTRHQATLREKEATITRLQARIAGLELLLHRKSEPITVPLQFSPSLHHRTPSSLPREWLATKPRMLTTDLSEIKSLNDEYLPKLREAGITSRAALLEKGLSSEGRDEISSKTGIPLSLILQWVRQAEFLRLKGMSGIYAELLNAAGIDSVTELTKCTAETLHQKFLDVNATKQLSRILPILAQIRDWIEQAKGLPHTSEELRLSVAGQTS